MPQHVRSLVRRGAVVLCALSVATAVAGAAVGTPAAAVERVLLAGPAGRALPTLPAPLTTLAAYPTASAALVSAPAGAAERFAAAHGLSATVDRAVTLTATASTGGCVSARRDLVVPHAPGYGVTVAVVDTGVSDTPALRRSSGRLVDGVDTSTGVVAAASGPLTDAYGHGTYISSVVAGGFAVDQTVGVAPKAHVLAVRAADSTGATSLSAVVAALDWLARNPDRAQVVALALGADRPDDAYGPDPLTNAVDAVLDTGTTVVVPSGNDPTQVSDPGFDPRALTVGAADQTNRGVAAFSGRGVVSGSAKPDLIASGVSVTGYVPTDSAVAASAPASLQPDGQICASGTSASVGVVAGAAAAMLSVTNRAASPATVKASLAAGALHLAPDAAGAGALRIPTALTYATDDTSPAPGGGPVAPGDMSWTSHTWSAQDWASHTWSSHTWSSHTWSLTTGATTP